MRPLQRWAPLLWLSVYVGSVLVLMGRQRWDLLVAGLGAIAIALGLALYLAGRREPGRPRPALFAPVLGGLAAFYVVAAVAAAPLGADYAVAALLAGMIPTTAAAIAFATARAMTVESDGRLHDTSPEDRGPLPGIGLDDTTPLGDTPETRGDISPHDLPKGHPARPAAERQGGRSR
jgi:hypothetical protein